MFCLLEKCTNVAGWVEIQCLVCKQEIVLKMPSAPGCTLSRWMSLELPVDCRQMLMWRTCRVHSPSLEHRKTLQVRLILFLATIKRSS